MVLLTISTSGGMEMRPLMARNFAALLQQVMFRWNKET